MKIEMESPRMGKKEKRKRVIRRLVERPKTVYERFPTFERDKVLDFTELFKGYTVQKSRISKRSFYGESLGLSDEPDGNHAIQWNPLCIRGRRRLRKDSWRLW